MKSWSLFTESRRKFCRKLSLLVLTQKLHTGHVVNIYLSFPEFSHDLRTDKNKKKRPSLSAAAPQLLFLRTSAAPLPHPSPSYSSYAPQPLLCRTPATLLTHLSHSSAVSQPLFTATLLTHSSHSLQDSDTPLLHPSNYSAGLQTLLCRTPYMYSPDAPQPLLCSTPATPLQHPSLSSAGLQPLLCRTQIISTATQPTSLQDSRHFSSAPQPLLCHILEHSSATS